MTRARKSQGKPADSAAETPPSGGRSETVSSPVQGGSAMTPKSTQKSEGRRKARKRRAPSQKTPRDSSEVGMEEAGGDDDGVVTFNFRDGSLDEQPAEEDLKSPDLTDGRELSTPRSKKSKVKQVSEGKEVSEATQSDHSQASVVAPQPMIESKETAKEAEDAVAMDTAAAQPQDDDAEKQEEAETKTPAAKKKRSRRRKRRPKQKVEEETTKRHKRAQAISFYCGNLPPGVNRETLKYFLQEEGIRPRITMHRPRSKEREGLTPKQRQYKKNVIKAAKKVFATVLVKTEEEAKKMSMLDGVNMPSTSHMDWDTELKIVRKLSQPKEFPFKVHVSGLHPSSDEEDLKSYLESQSLKPGQVLIFRRQKTQISRGFGFAWFRTLKEARKALALPRPSLGGSLLVIRSSDKDEKPPKKF